MSEEFFVYGEHWPGDTLYAHRKTDLIRTGLSGSYCSYLSATSTEVIGVLTEAVSDGWIVEAQDGELRLISHDRVVGFTNGAGRPRDYLLAETLAKETEALSLYRPDRHTDFDPDHIWAVTMKG